MRIAKILLAAGLVLGVAFGVRTWLAPEAAALPAAAPNGLFGSFDLAAMENRQLMAIRSAAGNRTAERIHATCRWTKEDGEARVSMTLKTTIKGGQAEILSIDRVMPLDGAPVNQVTTACLNRLSAIPIPNPGHPSGRWPSVADFQGEIIASFRLKDCNLAGPDGSAPR